MGVWAEPSCAARQLCRKLGAPNAFVPAAVYLLDEIVDLAKSSPEAAQSVADHVVKLLAHKSPVVKFKVRGARKATWHSTRHAPGR